MWKFIKSTAIFLSFSSVLYIVLIIIWGEFSPLKMNLNYNIGIGGHTFSRLNELKTTKNVDILFLGSSHTYRGFDTRIFKEAGYKSYILGSNGQTPFQTEFLLNKYLDSLNPKTVIFEVCPFVFSMDGIEASLVLISHDNINFETIKSVFKQNHLKLYNTLIYAIYREILYDDKNKYTEKRKGNTDTYINGGFVEKELIFYESENFEKQKWVFDKNQFKSIQNIVNELNKKKIKLILVQAPVTSDLYYSYENNIAFDNEIRKYGDYYNFNEILKLNDTLHFFDFHHLNEYGVEIFNESMLNILPNKNN